MIGLKELVVLAGVALALYGRSGVLRSRRFQSILPWIAPVRRPGVAPDPRRAARPAESPAPGVRIRPRPTRLDGDRVFWFLTILAATAVAAWIVTRILVLNGSGPGIAR